MQTHIKQSSTPLSILQASEAFIMATREGPDARERRREIQDIIKKKLYDNDIWLKIEIHKLNETKYCRRT